MILDLDIICMGDGVYAAKLKHAKLGLLKSIVEANSLSDATNKINSNLKQILWKKGLSSHSSPITFNFIAKAIDNKTISLDATPNELKKYHPDSNNEEDPRIWSLEEIVDEHGKSSWRTIKHDTPLMNKQELQTALLAKMFA